MIMHPFAIYYTYKDVHVIDHLSTALSLPLGKTSVMHMVVRERLPDEQSHGRQGLPISFMNC